MKYLARAVADICHFGRSKKSLFSGLIFGPIFRPYFWGPEICHFGRTWKIAIFRVLKIGILADRHFCIYCHFVKIVIFVIFVIFCHFVIFVIYDILAGPEKNKIIIFLFYKNLIFYKNRVFCIFVFFAILAKCAI